MSDGSSERSPLLHSLNDLQARYYSIHSNVQCEGLQGFYSSRYHVALERSHGETTHLMNILEIGGGEGQHLPYVKHGFDSYTSLDLRPTKIGDQFTRIKFVQGDARSMPFADNTFDRIITTCVLSHISNVELAISEMIRVCKPGAVLDIFLPCDPGLTYTLVQNTISHRKQQKLLNLSKIEVKALWAMEHTNHFLGLCKLLEFTFRNHKITKRGFPFPYGPSHFNLFYTYRINLLSS